MPLDRAARVGDPIQHTQSEGWGLGAALVGAVVGLAIVLTAPVSVPILLGVATVTGAALVGKGLGESIGSQRESTADGMIILQGARSVFTGPGMPNAARMT